MAKAKKVKRSGSDQRLEICLIIILSIIGVIMLYPLLVVLSTSFSAPSAVTSGKVWLFPVDFFFGGIQGSI